MQSTDDSGLALSYSAMTPTEVTEKLGLLRMKDRSWYCHPSNALEGDGLFEGEYKFSYSISERAVSSE